MVMTAVSADRLGVEYAILKLAGHRVFGQAGATLDAEAAEHRGVDVAADARLAAEGTHARRRKNAHD